MPGLTGLLLLGCGIGLVAVAWIWRRVARRRAMATVRWALLDPDPDLRRAGFVLAGQQGIARYAELLLEQAHRETDPTVSLALAEVVARNQWEPADDPMLVQLRLWAQQRLAHGAAQAHREPEPIPPPQPRPGEPEPSPAAVEALHSAPAVASDLGGLLPAPPRRPNDGLPPHGPPGAPSGHTQAEVAEHRKWIRKRLEDHRRGAHRRGKTPAYGLDDDREPMAHGDPVGGPEPHGAATEDAAAPGVAGGEAQQGAPPLTAMAPVSDPTEPFGSPRPDPETGTLEAPATTATGFPFDPVFDLSSWSGRSGPRVRAPSLSGFLSTLIDLAGLSAVLWLVGRYAGAFVFGFPKGSDAWGHLSKINLLMLNFPHVEWNFAWYAGLPYFQGSYPPLYHALAGFTAGISHASVPNVMVGLVIGMVFTAVLSFFGFVRVATGSRLAGWVGALLLMATPSFWTPIIQAGLYPRFMAFAFANVALFAAALHARSPSRTRFVATVAALAASLSTHPLVGVPALVVVTLLLTLPPRGLTVRARAARAGGFLAAVAGAVAYFYLPLVLVHQSRITFARTSPLPLILLFRPAQDLLNRDYVDSLPFVLIPLMVVLGGMALIATRIPRGFPRYLAQPSLPGSLPSVAMSGGTQEDRHEGGSNGGGSPSAASTRDATEQPAWLDGVLERRSETARRVAGWRARRADLAFPVRAAAICVLAGLAYLGYACLGYVGKGGYYINGLPPTSVLIFIGWMFTAAAALLFGGLLRTGRTRLSRSGLGSAVAALAIVSLALAAPLLPRGAKDFNTPAQRALFGLLPPEVDQRQFRVAGPIDASWINSTYGMPQVGGYQEQGIVHRDWQAYLEAALYNPSTAPGERAFVLDWYGVRWLVAGPGDVRVEPYDRHPELYEPIAQATTTGLYRTYRLAHADPIMTARSTRTALAIGADRTYQLLFRSLGPAGEHSGRTVLIHGSRFVDDYSPAELSRFDLIILYGASAHDARTAGALLSAYVGQGGGLIVEAADGAALLAPLSRMAGSPIPVTRIRSIQIEGEWNFQPQPGPLAQGIDFGAFGPPRYGDAGWLTYSGSRLQPWAEPLVTAAGAPVVVGGQYGRGRVVWTGLNLPYHVTTFHNAQESAFLVRMIDAVARTRPIPQPTFTSRFVDAQRRTISVSPGATGVLLKEYGRLEWHATVDGRPVTIYAAGPDMMYVPLPPNRPGPVTVAFSYRTSAISRAAIGVTLASVLILLLFWVGVRPRRKVR